jgi:hypothetical protein
MKVQSRLKVTYIAACISLIAGTCLETGSAMAAQAASDKTVDVASPMPGSLQDAVAAAKKGNREALSRIVESIDKRTTAVSDVSLSEFLPFLVDSDPQVQLLGAVGLAALSNSGCGGPLVDYLKAQNPKALQQLPPEQKEGRKWLWRLEAVAAAVKTLGEVGDESAVAVLESLRNLRFADQEDPVGDALAELGAARTLAKVPPDADNLEIGRVSRAIIKIRSPKAAVDLMAIVRDSNAPASIRSSATTALADGNLPGAAQFLLAMANDPNRPSNARCETLLMLGRTHDSTVEKPLLNWAQDPNRLIQRYALTALAVCKPEKYFSRWVDAIVDPNSDRESRMGSLQLGYQIPREIVRQQREQLYRSLSATTSDGRPDDQIRSVAWRLICIVLNEQPPIMLSKSSPYVGSIRDELRSNLITRRQAPDSPEKLDAKVEERLRSIVSYTSEATASPPDRRPPNAQRDASFSLQDIVTAAKNGKREQLSNQMRSFLDVDSMPEEMLPWFTALIDDNDIQVRAFGAIGLCAIRRPECSKGLIKFLNSIDPNTLKREPKSEEEGQVLWWQTVSVWRTAATLARMGDKSAIPALVRIKDTPRAEWSEPVMEALGTLGAVKELASLAQASKDARGAGRADSGLHQVRDPNKVSDLMTIVRDKKSSAALEALSKMNSPNVAPFLISVLRDGSYPAYLRGTALIAAAKTHDPNMEKPLLELAKDPNVTIRGYALMGLALYNPETYFTRWADAIVDTQEDPMLRESLLDHGSNFLPREGLGAQREQLYRGLEARDREGRPYDWVRVKMWMLIHDVLREEPPIVLSSPSSPYVFHIRGALRTGLARRGYAASNRDREKMAEECLKEIVSFYPEFPRIPPNGPRIRNSGR